MSFEYAIVVKNKTRLEQLIERFNTSAQAKFYIERLGGDFADYQLEHDRFHQSLELVQTRLAKLLKNKVVERQYLPNFLFASNQLIVVVGQDGLVANTAKYSKGCPIVAVNPEPQRFDGVLLPFTVDDFVGGVEAVMKGRSKTKEISFAQATLQDGQRLLAFNDLFIGNASHVSARYKITVGNQTEEHSSSGIIVSTAAGATGWMSSIFNMAYGVTGLFEKTLKKKHPKLKDSQLLFAVREPFLSKRSQAGLVVGKLEQNHSLTIESLMPTQGKIFSDGIEADFLHFNSGAKAVINLSEQKAILAVR